MARPTGFLDAFIDGYVSPPDDPAGRAQALATLRAWHLGIEAKDLAGLESLMHENIVIELPFSESGRTDPGYYRVFEGIPACIEFWRNAFKVEKEVHPFTDVDLSVSPDGSRLFLEMRGHLIMTSGVEYRNRYVIRCDIKAGKIRYYREYYNPIQAAFAFGRPIAGQFVIDRLE